MKKIRKSDARQILAMLRGETIPSSRLSKEMATLLEQEGLLLSRNCGSRCVYRMDAFMQKSCRTFLAQQFGIRVSLEEWIDTVGVVKSRAALVATTGDSKCGTVRPFRGFLVNSYKLIPANLNGKPFPVCPADGSAVFVNDTDHFDIPMGVAVVGMENAENFMQIRRQTYLFDSVLPCRDILFVSRYPQSALSDLRTWLLRIPNCYYHFGDFDLAGIHIYLSEIYSHLGDRSRFLIPDDIEERLSGGNAGLYNQQYAKYKGMAVSDARIQPLVDMIHRYGKGYEQEGYIECR